MTRILSRAALSLLLSTSAVLAQVNGGGGTGGGSGDFSGPGSSTADDFVQFSGTGGKTGKDGGYGPASFAPANIVVDVATSQAVHAADVSVCKMYRVTAGSVVFTFDAVSTPLSPNGCIEIETGANAATVTANAADTVSFAGITSGSGGSATLPVYGLYRITIKTGNLDIAGTTAQGNGVATQRTTAASKTANNCVKFDANGNTVDAGGACAASADGSVNQSLIANYWYWTLPGLSTNNGSGLGSGTIYYRPFYAGTSHTVGAVGAYLATASAGGNCAFAIYANSPTTNRPTGATLASVSGVSTTTAGPIHGNVSLAVTKGNWYWDAILCDNTTVTFTGNAGSGGLTDTWMVGSSSEANMNGNATNHYNQFSSGSATYPTFPSSPTVADNGQTANRTPIFYHQVASVP